LAALGHIVRGIDFSPSSMRHAREQAERDALEVDYELADLREAAFGEDFDFGMLIFAELNVFRREEAAAILAKAHDAIAPSSRLLIEPHTYEAVRSIGATPARAQSLESGLFSARPHQLLEEAFWIEQQSVAVHR
jgi:hypothetical protein